MDFRLRAFIAVAQQLNFTKAAKELFISQPAISKHIQELENIYGVQLFERNGSKITLTSAGEIFLKHAESITNSYKELQLEMNLWSGKFTGNLKVGASTTIAQHTLPPKIAQFIMAFPDIKLSVIMGNSEQIEQALREHTIDVGLVEGIHRKNEFKHVH
ncbi:MAG: LysR family transcriptional regulator, partial [Bacteroidales bacterium]